VAVHTGFTLARSPAHRYHRRMANIILVFLIIFMVLTVVSLLVGVFAMGKGGEFNKKNSNMFMRYRVLFQGGAVVCFILYLLVR
jgi:flagellar basal body-associated protein FliL